MSGTRTRHRRPLDHRAKDILAALMGHKGWVAKDVEKVSERTGHPDRAVSARTVYRVVDTGYVPDVPTQFEIAATFGLNIAYIWGGVPLPGEYAYLNAAFGMAAAA